MNTDGAADVPAAGSPVTRIDDVEFWGGFEPAEREYLVGQFSRCRFELLARSPLDSRLVLLAWQAAGGPTAAGPPPLRAAPSRVTYVLDRRAAGGAATTGRYRSEAAASLTRIDRARDLEQRFPGHFPGAQVRVPWSERVRRALRRAIPGAIVAVLALWLALVLRYARGGP